MEANYKADERAYSCKQYLVGNTTPLFKKIDIFVFFILLLFIMLYQVQLVFEWISILRVRELLYAYLYIRIIFFYKLKIPYASLLVIAYLAYSIFIFFHTMMIYDMTLALQGFMRFVNVALLAPLATTIIANKKQLQFIINLWCIVFFIGFITAFYQLIGGDLSWLLGDYIAVRGGLVRAKTLLGEPNIGAMASIFIISYAFYGALKSFWRTLLVVISSLFIIISLSKAAIAGLIVFVCLSLLINYKAIGYYKTKNVIKLMQLIIIFTFIIITLVFLLPEVNIIIDRYFNVAISAFTGTGEIQGTTKGIWHDLINRAYFYPQRYIENALSRSDTPLLHLIIGNSFGAAGSVARGLDIEGAVLPHNSYLEIVLVGGLFMLIIFLFFIKTAYKRLMLIRKQDIGLSFLVFWLILFVIFMISYPIIYEPFLGALFWIVVGVAFNNRLYKEVFE